MWTWGPFGEFIKVLYIVAAQALSDYVGLSLKFAANMFEVSDNLLSATQREYIQHGNLSMWSSGRKVVHTQLSLNIHITSL